ncbi:MAG: hypothetical protein R2845_14535 [Thermomicrobiales bacterium]
MGEHQFRHARPVVRTQSISPKNARRRSGRHSRNGPCVPAPGRVAAQEATPEAAPVDISLLMVQTAGATTLAPVSDADHI